MLPEISPLELQIQTMTSELERLPQDKSIWSLTPTGKGGQLALDLKLKVNENQYLDASRVYEMDEFPPQTKASSALWMLTCSVFLSWIIKRISSNQQK